MAEIRIAGRADVAAIATLEKKLFSDAWSEKMVDDCLKQKHYQILVCVNDTEADESDCGAKISRTANGEEKDNAGTVVGYLISTHVADEAELLRIGVSPMMRRRGIGRSLMRRFARLCDELATPNAFLEVRISNAAAIALYEESGFQVTGVRKNYYHQPDEDACLMAGEMQRPESAAAR